DKGGAGDVGKHGRESQATRESVADKGAAGEQLAEGHNGGADTSALTAVWRQGLAKSGGRGQEQQRADDGQDDENATPGGEAEQQPAKERGEDWSQTVHEHEQ